MGIQLTQEQNNSKSRPLKIAMVCDHFYPRVGGIETQILGLSNQLTQAGHQITIICGSPGPETVNDINIIRFSQYLLPGFQISYNPAILKKIILLFRESVFDLVHIHISVVSPIALLAIIAASRTNLPCVLTSHSLMNFGNLIYRFFSWFYPWQNKVVTLTGVSQHCAENFAKAAGNRCQVLPNGIHHDFWKIQPLEHKSINIVCISRMNIKKQVQSLIKVFAIILKTNTLTNHQLKLHLIGKGPFLYFLKKLSEFLGIKHQVFFHGYLPKESIKDIFKSCDIFVLPCNKESFGIALAEALSAGLPVIAMDNCGTKDLVQHGVNGLLAKDKKDLFLQLKRLIENSTLRKTLAANAQKSVACFDWNKVLAKHLQLYEEAIVSYHRR